MSDIASINGFVGFGNHIWLNSAHQGALPSCAAREAQEAIEWKKLPFELTQERFNSVPMRLRKALCRLIGVKDDQIILGNSASYGIHVIAHGYPWKVGDEVIVAANDFPADILPWLLCERRYGIKVVQISPARHVLSAKELQHAITTKTRVLCTTWVHSFSGRVTDILTLGNICREHGISFVVNASQALGARPLDLSGYPIDALTCTGFKWLCGPYGTGFCWVSPELLQRLNLVKAYWLTMREALASGNSRAINELRPAITARAFDIFGTANFFNFKPWAAAIEWLLEIGINHIATHDQALVDQFLTNLNRQQYNVVSESELTEGRSTLVLIAHRNSALNSSIFDRLELQNVHVALRNGAIRISPHLYNSSDDIDYILDILNSF